MFQLPVVIGQRLRADRGRKCRKHESHRQRGGGLERPAHAERNHAHLPKGCDPVPQRRLCKGYARGGRAASREARYFVDTVRSSITTGAVL